MLKVLNIILLQLMVGFAFSQNSSEDLRKVRDQFLHAKEIGFEVEVYHFKNKDSKGELLSKGIMRKSGKNYYSSFMGDKMIINKQKGTVIIDEINKEITYFDVNKEIEKPQQIELPDSLFSLFKYVGKEGNVKKYEIKSEDIKANILRTVLNIDDNYRLKKVIYYYNKNTEKKNYNAYKLEIHYKNIITTNIRDSYFNINEYIIIKNNKIQLTKHYANFKLLD